MQTPNETQQTIDNIESRIDNAFLSCIKDLNANKLLLIKYELIEILTSEYSDATIYWMAYCSNYLSILYLQMNETDKEERELKEGIKLLENIQNKDSEHLSLIGIMDGYATKFCSPIRIPKHIEKCRNYAKEALSLFEKNPRAHLSLGIFDFHTHRSYGGGNLTEISLTNAIKYKNEQDPKSCTKPYWGSSLAYQFLVLYYLRNKNIEQAKFYWNEAIEIFPNDRNIIILKKQLQNES